MDVVILARMQFTANFTFHILFPRRSARLWRWNAASGRIGSLSTPQRRRIEDLNALRAKLQRDSFKRLGIDYLIDTRIE